MLPIVEDKDDPDYGSTAEGPGYPCYLMHVTVGGYLTVGIAGSREALLDLKEHPYFLTNQDCQADHEVLVIMTEKGRLAVADYLVMDLFRFSFLWSRSNHKYLLPERQEAVLAVLLSGNRLWIWNSKGLPYMPTELWLMILGCLHIQSL